MTDQLRIGYLVYLLHGQKTTSIKKLATNAAPKKGTRIIKQGEWFGFSSNCTNAWYFPVGLGFQDLCQIWAPQNITASLGISYNQLNSILRLQRREFVNYFWYEISSCTCYCLNIRNESKHCFHLGILLQTLCIIFGLLNSDKKPYWLKFELSLKSISSFKWIIHHCISY